MSYYADRNERRSDNRKVVIRLVWFIFVGSVVMYMGINLYAKESGDRELVSSKNISSSTVLSESAMRSEAPKISLSLQSAVTDSLEGAQGTYGVYIKNLKTSESYFQNEHKTFEAASLYKLWVMGAAYKQIESGVLDANETLSEDIPTLNKKFDIDPELAEQTEGGITLTTTQALTQMITISHNYAALLLTEKIKLSSVADFLEENNFSESKVGTDGNAPTTTPYDVAQFMEKLYKGKLGNAESTGKMLDLLKRQKLNGKLPKNLPQDVEIAHKTGEIGWFSHDAGIVYSDSGDYIIVVMSESSSPPDAEDRIANLSKAVYEYFESK